MAGSAWVNVRVLLHQLGMFKLQKKEKEKIRLAKKAWQATLEVFDSWD
jgi:hypothetical protein